MMTQIKAQPARLKTKLIMCLLLCGTLISHLCNASPVPKVAAGELVRLDKLDFGDIQARPVDVWLPPNYLSQPNTRFDVLYVHDGQMQFDASVSWNRQAWELDDTAIELMESGKVRPFIVVAIHNTEALRHSEYFPQKPFKSLPNATQTKLLEAERSAGVKLFAAPLYSDLYLDFIVRRLKPYIDQHFRVNTTAEHTFIMGSSMGGLISMYAALEYPDVFGAAACLSTHWPGVFSEPDNPLPAAFADYLGSKLSPTSKTRLYFDHGDATLDALYPPLQAQMDNSMRKSGYPETLWESRYFKGADHTETAWAERLAIPLQFLLSSH
ncbi:alpha/beta hydrolase [Shewanella jiangmenensis]|nr:alpha/beta fold hydrolase [Shewanella jiangmenensis]